MRSPLLRDPIAEKGLSFMRPTREAYFLNATAVYDRNSRQASNEGQRGCTGIIKRYRDKCAGEPVYCGDVENSFGLKPGSSFAFAKHPVSLLIRFMKLKISVENNLREKPRC
jgi:hypothetical protein